MKIIKIKKSSNEKKVSKKIELIKGLNHPNILKIFEFLNFLNIKKICLLYQNYVQVGNYLID